MSKASIKRARERAFLAQRGRCHYCGFPTWLYMPQELTEPFGLSEPQARRLQCTAEHLKPKCEGGSDSPENLVAAYAHCNHTRRKRDTGVGRPSDVRSYATAGPTRTWSGARERHQAARAPIRRPDSKNRVNRRWTTCARGTTEFLRPLPRPVANLGTAKSTSAHEAQDARCWATFLSRRSRLKGLATKPTAPASRLSTITCFSV